MRILRDGTSRGELLNLHRSLAEDTRSDVTVAVAQSWTRYDPCQPFPPWARGVARRAALANLRKGQRQSVPLEDEVLESMAVALDRFGGEAEQDPAGQALRECVQQLSETNQPLVRRRFFEEESYPDMAKATGRSVDALYGAFGRIHHALARRRRGEIAQVSEVQAGKANFRGLTMGRRAAPAITTAGGKVSIGERTLSFDGAKVVME